MRDRRSIAFFISAEIEICDCMVLLYGRKQEGTERDEGNGQV